MMSSQPMNRNGDRDLTEEELKQLLDVSDVPIQQRDPGDMDPDDVDLALPSVKPEDVDSDFKSYLEHGEAVQSYDLEGLTRDTIEDYQIARQNTIFLMEFIKQQLKKLNMNAAVTADPKYFDNIQGLIRELRELTKQSVQYHKVIQELRAGLNKPDKPQTPQIPIQNNGGKVAVFTGSVDDVLNQLGTSQEELVKNNNTQIEQDEE